MGNLNKVLLIGRLGKDPEKRVTSSGASVTNLTLATSESWIDQSGNKQEKTEWHKVVLWNKLADIAEQYLKKGSQIYIEGRIQTKEWQDKDGNKRYSTEINGQTLQFLDSKGAGDSSSAGQYPSSQGNRPPSDNFQSGGNQGNNYYQNPGPGSGGPSNQLSQPQPPSDQFIEDDIPF